MAKKIMLFTLQTFSTTGGIQKMTRSMAHSLHNVSLNNDWEFNLWSAYDEPKDVMTQYIPQENFKGFGSRLSFIGSVIKNAMQFDVVILSHINLAFAGRLIQMINPKCKIWLVAHGIEVWRKLSLIKKTLLKNCDRVICVSNFTKAEVIKLHGVDAEKCTVLNNVIDPFMRLPDAFTKPVRLLTRYGLTGNEPIVFTLTRLSAAEQYKGYEQVIKVVGKLKATHPTIKYIIAGQYDAQEEARLKKIIYEHHVEEKVILTGFINEDELTDHFLLADVFVLPSRNEGFGIVFIEALACGLPVICGNVDGSLDAIKNGLLGKAIDPDDLGGLEHVLNETLQQQLTETMRKQLQTDCLHYFSEKNYIKTLQQLLQYDIAG